MKDELSEKELEKATGGEFQIVKVIDKAIAQTFRGIVRVCFENSNGLGGLIVTAQAIAP